MKIVHLAASADDGAGIATRRIHAALLAAGADSRLLVRDAGRDLPHAATALGAPPASRLRRLLARLDPAARRARAARALLAAPGPAPELFSLPDSACRPEDHPAARRADVLQLHWVNGFVDHRHFLARTRQPIAWTLHDQQPYLGGFHYEQDRDACPRYAALDAECLALKRASLAAAFPPARPLCILGNSEWNTSRARASGLFPAHTRFEIIYYPLDLAAYAPRDPAAARAALGLPPSAFIVGFASTSLANPRKGLADLLAALRDLPAAAPASPGTLHLVSFGRPPEPAHLAACPHPWHHLGFLDGDRVKAAAYAAMDVFVAPSRAEAFGQTAIEALACATPVLATAVGGLVEAVDHGRCGVLAPPADPAALREALASLRSDPAHRRSLAAAGRDHVTLRHDPARVAAAHLALYSDLASGVSTLP